MAKRVFQRILLKLSGELLGGADGRGLDAAAAAAVCERVREAVDLGVQVGLVVGAGNLFRGLGASRGGMERCAADAIGMLGTVMNALALREALAHQGLAAEVQSAIPMAGVVEAFDHRRADSLLASGRVVLFAAGTGHPFFTTDTTAALRACQIGADALLKGTKVDGIYDSDPVRNPAAKRYARLSYAEALAHQLGVMDSSAFSLCMENRLPIIVFKFGNPGDLAQLLSGDLRSATLVNAEGQD
jgi:uridylate kinase